MRRGLDQKQRKGKRYLGSRSADIKGNAGRTRVPRDYLVPLILLNRLRLLPSLR
jgi:hypothetical protein